MSRFNNDPSRTSSGGPLRITEEEAASSHVDDLLKRQASLQGDKGITADRSRKWYYSNWFIFGLTGFLFSLLGWALLEPNYSDYLHFRAKIIEIDVPNQRAIPGLDGKQDVDFSKNFTALVKLKTNDTNISNEITCLLPGKAVLFDADGKPKVGIGPDDLKLNTEYGVHVNESPGINVLLGVETKPQSGAYDTLESARKVSDSISLVFFAIVSAIVGLGIGAADGLMCRLLRRALLCGIAGLLIGFVGGFASGMLANVIYSMISAAAQGMVDDAGNRTTMGFLTQLVGRSLGWALAGTTMGLGQGVVLRSHRLLLYGFMGGLIGGLLGGLLFDPIQDFLVPETSISAHWARLVGITTVGTFVGLMIGVVELLARDAWLNMVRGPLAGKEFLIFKDLVRVGASPASDIYLFNDAEVKEDHALIRAVADNYEIESVGNSVILINGRAVNRSKLRQGDQITLGKTVFAFQRKRSG